MILALSPTSLQQEIVSEFIDYLYEIIKSSRPRICRIRLLLICPPCRQNGTLLAKCHWNSDPLQLLNARFSSKPAFRARSFYGALLKRSGAPSDCIRSLLADAAEKLSQP